MMIQCKKGVAFRDTLAMPLQRGSGVGVAECNCRIIGTEEILVALPQNPHLSKFRAVKHFEAQVFVFAHFHPFFSRLFRWLDHREMVLLSRRKKERLPTTEESRKFITALCMYIQFATALVEDCKIALTSLPWAHCNLDREKDELKKKQEDIAKSLQEKEFEVQGIAGIVVIPASNTYEIG